MSGPLASAFSSSSSSSRAAARVLVIASSEFLANPFDIALAGELSSTTELREMAGLYAQQSLTATVLTFRNTLDWMIADTASDPCPAANGLR